MRFAALLTCVVFSGCVTAGLALDDTRRDTLLFGEIPPGKWREVSAPGFTLLSDVDPEQLQDAAQAIAQAETVARTLLASPTEPRPLQIVLYASRFEFEARHARADSELLGETLYLCVPLRESTVLDAFVQVRVTHALPYRPHWLLVGLAADIAATRWKSRDSILVGAPHTEMYAAYVHSRSVSVRQLHTWFGDDDPHLALAGLSWALVRWASSEQPALFARYLELLAKGDATNAWAETFAPLEAHLDRDIYRYIGMGRFHSRIRAVPDEPHVAPIVRVSDAPK